MINLTIDEKEVSIEEGATILEAAQSVGIRIPTFCYHKRLLPFGACRVCVVEVEQMKGRLVPACSTPATNGMVVCTNAPHIVRARKTVLELLLIHHPLDCPVCDAAGECELQNLTYEYGVSTNQFSDEKRDRGIDYVSPLVERNVNRCVLCGMCVRVCDEIVGASELSFVNRGFKTKIATDFDRPLSCEFCGECIEICPVGALVSRPFKFKSRVWNLRKDYTVCSFCSTGCTLCLEVKDDQILRVTSDDGRGTNKGSLCSKGRFGFHYVDHPERLKTPLIRKGEELVEATWDEALETVAEKLQTVKEVSGGGAIAGLCSARLTNEEAYLFQKLMRSCLETNHIDHSGGYGYSGLEVLHESLGYAAMTNSIEDIRDADTVFLLRSDLCETHPVVGYQVNVAVKRDGAKLIVATSRDVKMFKFAAHHLILKPGTEVALVNAMVHCILEEGLADSEFVSRHVDGLSSLEKEVGEYMAERASEITGLSEEAIREAARTFAQAKKAVVIVSAGLGLPVNNRELALVALDLILVTGNVGKPGAGLAILGEKCNSQGALDMGLHPRWLPGYQAVDDTKVREKLEAAWQAPVPAQPGYHAREFLEKARNGAIKALYIVGENPVVTYPDSLSVKKALESVDFLVVQDLFLTPTARLADVVLPCASFAEKEGTFTNCERRIQKITTSVSCRGEARSDMDIFGELAQRWGRPFKATSPDAVMGEIGEVVPIYGGVAYDRLGEEGIQWPCPDRSHPGTPRLYADSFPNGKVRLLPVTYENKVKDSSDEYPFVLLSGASLFHSGSLSSKSSGLTQVCPGARIEISRGDADKLGLREGDLCVVRSRAAEIKGPVKINRYQMEGSVFVPYHFAETPVNEVAATWESFATVNMEKA